CGPPICRSPHRESTHRRRRIAPSPIGVVFMLAEISVSAWRAIAAISVPAALHSPRRTPHYSVRWAAARPGSIGKPAHWSWAWKAILTGAIPKAAYAQCAVCVPPATASLEHDIDWFGTARARIGYGANGWLACHRRLCLRTRRAQGHRNRGRRERLAHPKRDAERLDHRRWHRT